MPRPRKARMPKCIGPRCERRREGTLEETRKHFAECTHPHCVALVAFYKEIALYVQTYSTDPLSEKGERHGYLQAPSRSYTSPAAQALS